MATSFGHSHERSSRGWSALAALCLLLGALVPGIAQAQAVCQQPGVSKIYRLGGPNALARPAASREELAQRLEALGPELGTVLGKHGVSHLADRLIAAARSGEGVTERNLVQGETFEWMSYRRGGKATTAGPVCIATSKTYDAWEIQISEEADGKRKAYQFVVPKICINLSLARMTMTDAVAPPMVRPPICKLSAERSCDKSRLITVDASGSKGGVEITLGSKTVIPSGASSITWEGADESPYEAVTVTARGRNVSADGKPQTCETSVPLAPCQPASCEISVPAEAKAKETVQVDLSGHWAEGGIAVEILDAGGNAVASPTLPLPPPSSSEVSFGRPGSYTLRGTATNELGDTATCEAMIDVKPLWTFRPFAARFDPSDDEDFRSSDGGARRSQFMAGNGAGLGASLERHFSDRLGLEAALLIGSLDSTFMLDRDEEWGMVDDDLSLLALTFGPNFHLTPNKRADFYIGPFIGLVQLGDGSYSTLGETFRTDFDDEFVFGAQAGLDVPFGASSPWALHAGALFMDLTASGNNAEVDLDPITFTLGLAYDF